MTSGSCLESGCSTEPPRGLPGPPSRSSVTPLVGGVDLKDSGDLPFGPAKNPAEGYMNEEKPTEDPSWEDRLIHLGGQVQYLGYSIQSALEDKDEEISRLSKVNESQRVEIQRLRKLLEDRG